MFSNRLCSLSKHLSLNIEFVFYQNIYLCIQTKFPIKTFTFVFKQSFISKHLPLYSNKVLYQNIYLCIQTKFYIKIFIFEYRLCFISKHLYLNTKVNVLYQNIYI